MSSLLYPNRISLIGSKHLDPRADLTNDRCTTENGLHLFDAEIAIHVNIRYAAVYLTAVRIALDGDIHQRQAWLLGTGNLSCQKNSACTSPENWLGFSKGAQRLQQVLQADQFEHGSALSAWDDEAIAGGQIAGRADFNGMRLRALQSPHMRMEIALEGQDAYVLQRLVTLHKPLPAAGLE